MMDNEAVRYFGEAWPSGICDEGVRVPAPAQQTCLWCGEGFVEGDRGYFMGSGQPVHLACGLRAVIGSVGHLQKKCFCYGGAEEDPQGLSRREAAEAAFAEWQRQKGRRIVTLLKYARN